MKRIITQAEKDALAAVNSKSTQAILRHVLSPVEQAALRHSFQPFRYTLNGAKIYISAANSRQLLHGIMLKIEQLTFIVTKEQSSRQIPLRLREVFDDPAVVLSITPIVRNRLCRLECYTLFSIMQRGKTYFIEKGLGKQAMQTLEALFSKHEVSHLFK